MTDKPILLNAIVPNELCGERIDKVLATLFPDYSRQRLNNWLKEKHITVDGKHLKSKDKVKGGEAIEVSASLQDETLVLPEKLPLDIVYEDTALIILNKEAGRVVHPGAGHHEHTLVNALLFHDSALSLLPRAGLIHRIDKDTTGLLIIAKTLESYHALVKAMQARDIHRHYYALVNGTLVSGGVIETNMGRDPKNRIKMAVTREGKHAITHYKIKRKFTRHTLLDITLETGRTHQIRTHMAHIRHPIVGDVTYGNQVLCPKGASDKLQAALKIFKRQALHAYQLSLNHPITHEEIKVSAPIPKDYESLLTLLEEHEENTPHH
jgi:23S rRNA pseudouridine1911/1915/1917 synthase